ncbi:MAG: helix-turn-helix domain-containing protein [Mogibacterium sp.]|nr:helix-turn-helix domain-containing protein [Mogibacterium sp.]
MKNKKGGEGLNFLDRIDAYCKSHNMSQSYFERAAGLSKGQITKWRNGFKPGLKSQQKLAAFMNISIAELMREGSEDGASGDESRFEITMDDDSMEPYILKGYIIIADKNSKVESGDIAIISTPGDQTICRKVVFNEDGIILQPYNRKYDAVYYRYSEMESLPVALTGKVVRHIGKH